MQIAGLKVESIVGFAKNHDFKPGEVVRLTFGEIAKAFLFWKIQNSDKLISQILQGDTFSVGDRPHAWNAVFLEDSWRLVDPTWGAGQSDDSFFLLWMIVFLPIGHYNEALEEFTFSINEHYFLTDPDEMQFSHFPFLQADSKSNVEEKDVSPPG